MENTPITMKDLETTLETKLESALDNFAAKFLLPAFEKIDERFDRLEERMDRLEARMDRLEARMDSLEARMNSLEARMNSLEEEIVLVRKELEDVKIRLAKLEKRTDEDSFALAKDVVALQDRDQTMNAWQEKVKELEARVLKLEQSRI